MNFQILELIYNAKQNPETPTKISNPSGYNPPQFIPTSNKKTNILLKKYFFFIRFSEK